MRTLVGLLVLVSTAAYADRASIATNLNQLSASAAGLAKTAKASDDRGARKKFGPAATELSDDLAALSRRFGKDVDAKALDTDAAAADKEALALIELADEASDKEERKQLRAQAQLIEQGIAGARRELAALKDAAPAAPVRFTGRLLNTSNACSWEENLKFVVSQNGQVVYTTQLVFPGKEQGLVLNQGKYFVQWTDVTGKSLGQINLDASHDGWVLKSGCVNQ